jgi:hypothetical protein
MPSTVIAFMHYNIETSVLKIGFVSGLEYEYKNVPEEIYNQLKTSGSKGIYFNEHIKGRYKFEKVK